MNNKKINKKMLLITSSIALLPLSVLTSTISCSKVKTNDDIVPSDNVQDNIQTIKDGVLYNVSEKLSVNDSSVRKLLPKKVNVYEAKYSENARKELNQIQANLTVKDLDNDFKKVLTKFYEAYEYEDRKNKVEIEIERIKVVKKNNDGSFQLKVTYEKEDKKGDKKITKEITWTPKLALISKNDIEEIKKVIKKYSNKDNKYGIDLGDIKEIFLGEKYADDEDDYGIFDRIAKLNKDYNNLTHLVAYEIQLSDIFDKLEGAKPRKNNGSNVTKNTKFMIPSLSINDGRMVFVPNEVPDLDYSIKTDLTLDLVIEEYKGANPVKEIKNDSPEKLEQIVAQLNKFLLNPVKASDFSGANEISGIYMIIETKEEGYFKWPEYKIVIEFSKARKAADMFYVYQRPVSGQN